jgi:hypothetical protein
MDFLFNKTIPKNTNTKIIFSPKSKTFINGLTYNYSIYYHPMLFNVVEEKEFMRIMDKLNDLLYMSWPCTLCFGYGYLCCLCTIGISFIFPGLQVSKSKTILLQEIDELNEKYFSNKGLELSYHSNCLTSWLVLEKIQTK